MKRILDDDLEDSDDRQPVDKRSGRVTFDDRGNAVWDTGRRNSVRVHPGLSIAEEGDSPLGEIRHNRSGAKKGYDPYESGLLAGGKKDIGRKRKDLSKLSEWIKLKKNMDGSEK